MILPPNPTITPTVQPTVTPTGAPGITLNQTPVAVQRGGSVALFPNAAVTGANTNFAGSTLTISLPSSATSGLSLVAPGDANGITGVLSNNNQTLVITLGADTTAAQLQSYLQGIQVSANGTAEFGSVTYTVTGAAPNNTQTVSTSGSIQVQNTAGLEITVDPSQGTDAAALRFATLQEAVNQVANGDSTVTLPDGADGNRAGSRIRLLAGAETVATNSLTVLIGEANSALNTFDADLTGLTVMGPNAGISDGSTPGTRVADFQLTGGIMVGAPRVTLTGFTILEGGEFNAQGNDDSTPVVGVEVSTNASQLAISEVVFRRTGESILRATNGVLTSSLAPSPSNSGLTVRNCSFDGWTRGVFLYGESNDTPLARVNDGISGNFFNNLGFTAIQSTNGADLTITGNVVKNILGGVDASIAGEGNFYLMRLRNDLTTNLGNIVVTGNDFDDSADLVAQTASTGTLTLDVSNNWWNDANGPEDGGTPDFDAQENTGVITATVNPFLVADPFPTR